MTLGILWIILNGIASITGAVLTIHNGRRREWAWMAVSAIFATMNLLATAMHVAVLFKIPIPS